MWDFLDRFISLIMWLSRINRLLRRCATCLSRIYYESCEDRILSNLNRPKFDTIRDRADFKTLVAELEKKAEPKK
jgi:hypothetical protein